MVNLTIKVTKDILKSAMYCGTDSHSSDTPNSTLKITQNCAIARAVRDIFPEAIVEQDYMVPFPEKGKFYGADISEDGIRLPKRISEYIMEFDATFPKLRVEMPEVEFTISIPEEIINHIDISEVTKQLENHPTLKLQTV